MTLSTHLRHVLISTSLFLLPTAFSAPLERSHSRRDNQPGPKTTGIALGAIVGTIILSIVAFNVSSYLLRNRKPTSNPDVEDPPPRYMTIFRRQQDIVVPLPVYMERPDLSDVVLQRNVDGRLLSAIDDRPHTSHSSMTQISLADSNDTRFPSTTNLQAPPLYTANSNVTLNVPMIAPVFIP